ncbi:MAG: hypothetical protein U1D97_15730 [Desulfuromonadales bacterium]|nr:hypothetical protein [Desulfuromonadales bacterium]
MSNHNPFDLIEDSVVRSYVQSNIKDMVRGVSLTLKALENQPREKRYNIRAAGELYSTSMLVEPLAKGFTLDAVKNKIEKGVWNTVCNIKSDDKTKGEPDEKAKQIFDKEGIGTEIIEAAIIAGFAALGSAWGAFGTLLGTAIGKKIRDWGIGVIASQLDEMVENKLEGYCALVPTE